MVRVTEGPFFSEAAIYYQHIQEVVRLYNVPGENFGWAAGGDVAAQNGVVTSRCVSGHRG